MGPIVWQFCRMLVYTIAKLAFRKYTAFYVMIIAGSVYVLGACVMYVNGSVGHYNKINTF